MSPTMCKSVYLCTLLYIGLARRFQYSPMTIPRSRNLLEDVKPRSSRALAVEAPSASEVIRKAQAFTLQKITSELGLVIVDDICSDSLPEATMQSFAPGSGLSAHGESRIEHARVEVAWCSGLSVGSTQGSLSAMTIWCNPTVYVPHFFSCAGISADGKSINLYIDWRPREEAGYNTRLPDGTFPEPTSRDMFALKSQRDEFEALYFTQDVEQWCEALRAMDGGSLWDAFPGMWYGVAGPCLVQLSFPLNEATLVATVDALNSAAMRWLDWMKAADTLPQRKTMTVYAHDTKVKAAVLEAMRAAFKARKFGRDSEVEELIQASHGPSDLADRGSAMNAAANDNIDGTEVDEAAVAMQQLVANEASAPPAPAVVYVPAPAGGGPFPVAKDCVWGWEAKKKVFDAWDPEKPRDYNNFNPFERNDESSMCDTNGCFPGQSRGYTSPNRPDLTWEKTQEERALMAEMKKDPKFSITGKPGNFKPDWQKNLGAPPGP